jgi:DNA polymerase III subunit epsilon
MNPRKNEIFKWQLERPLAIMDIEATGINPRIDRIIDLAIVKLMPDGKRSVRTFRINPGIPIPPETTKIHGIRDSDVADSPSFGLLAPEILDLLKGCDLGGYNLIRFDIPMLVEEFLRNNIKFDIEGRKIIDAQRIFHKREPRDLSAALVYYCGEMHFDAHGAESDALATLRVFEGQFKRYPDLPREIDVLDQYCNPREPDWVDRTGKLKWQNGEIVLNFSRKKGESLKNLIQNDPGFIKWIMRGDFPQDMQEIVQNALQGKWPKPLNS